MKRSVTSGSSPFSDGKTNASGDWRAEMLANIRALIHEADPEMIEERKWAKATNPGGVPVFSHSGIVCTLETYRTAVKLTFAKGASLKDPARLFNSSLEGNARSVIDIHEGDSIDEKALKDLIRIAAAFNSRSPARSTGAK